MESLERCLLWLRLWNSKNEVYHTFISSFFWTHRIGFVPTRLTPLYLLNSQILNSILFFIRLLPIVCYMAHVVMKSPMHLAWLMENAANTIPRNLMTRQFMVKMAILSMQDLIMDILSQKMVMCMTTRMWSHTIHTCLQGIYCFYNNNYDGY